MVGELKVSTMDWIKRPRIHQDAVDTTRSEGGWIASDSIIEDFFLGGIENRLGSGY
jgi:hypothetical protein